MKNASRCWTRSQLTKPIFFGSLGISSFLSKRYHHSGLPAQSPDRAPEPFEYGAQVVPPDKRRIRWPCYWRTGLQCPKDGLLRFWPPDLSRRAVAIAEEGVWGADKSHEIPKHYLRAYTLKGVGENEGKIKAAPSIRMIRFMRLNRNDRSYPAIGKFDLIFCRNVLTSGRYSGKMSVFCEIDILCPQRTISKRAASLRTPTSHWRLTAISDTCSRPGKWSSLSGFRSAGAICWTVVLAGGAASKYWRYTSSNVSRSFTSSR